MGGHPLAELIKLDSSTLISCGNYGFVFRSQFKDGRDIAIKLVGTRWQHIAVHEFAEAAKVRSHENIIEYIDVLIFKDEDRKIAQLLQTAKDEHKLGPQQKRTKFPDKYICLLEEFMDLGTVQNWIDHQCLLRGGMLKTMRLVANALAYMHTRGVAHNDIKPDNVLLAGGDDRTILVKLADLGLAEDSTDFEKDCNMFGMLIYCMVTEKSFGAIKFKPELKDDLIDIVVRSVDSTQPPLRDEVLRAAIAEVPVILRKVWDGCSFSEVRDSEFLRGWRFFDGDLDVGAGLVPGDAEHPEGPGRRPSERQLAQLGSMAQHGYANRARASLLVEGADPVSLQRRKHVELNLGVRKWKSVQVHDDGSKPALATSNTM